MAKAADRYLECEPWRVVELGFHAGRSRASESIFSLANELMGVRGYPEEGTDAPSMIGSYLNGVYELQGEDTPGGYKGVVKQTHYMVCAADFFHVRLWQGKTPLLLSEAAEDFERTLDMRSGLLRRAYRRPLPGGGSVWLCFERLLCMEDPHMACQRITLVSDIPASLEMELGVDGSVRHQATGECLWKTDGRAMEQSLAGIRMRTATTAQTVDYAFALDAACPLEPVMDERRVAFRLNVRLRPAEPFTITRRILNTIDAQGAISLRSVAAMPDFETLLQQNRAHYEAFWKTADVEIDGDVWNQQGIRYCVFQLHQTYRGLDGRHNIGAKGLTGEAYNGHAFWDSETYCLPYYLLNDRKAAKSLLMYRYRTLPQALKRARQLDCKGACYPIATLNGNEACTLWQHASLQMHPSTAVAYAVWQYVLQTGDRPFLYREGLEMLTEICRYLASRGDWNADHTGFGFYGVMGPDEFHLMVNNNFYTNFMGKKTLEFTLEALDKAPDAARFATPDERALWRAIARHMLLPQRDDLVYEQHEGYFSLPRIDIHAIPVTDFPLYEHWSYDRIYRTDMIKQPDVLMAMFLHPADFTEAEKRANYDYYEPRCIHESSLSPSIHAILAQELGMDGAAFDFFGFATRMDLDNYNRNTCDGLHQASIAAAWVTIVYGFAGLRTDGPALSLRPSLPAQWTRYAFRFLAEESVVYAEVDADGCRLSLVSGKPVAILLNGQRTTVSELKQPEVNAPCESVPFCC